jgi:hypothetical protein
MSRRWIARALVVMMAAAACTSPTIPLPPPALPSITSNAQSATFHLSSDRGALPNALVLSISRNTALNPEDRVRGTFADTQGSWALDVLGISGDVLDVSQESGSESSSSVSVTLPQRPAAADAGP